MLATGLIILTVAIGLYVFRHGIYSFWDADVRRIDTEQAQELLKKKDLFLLDARTPEEFAVSHLKGATRFEEGLSLSLPKGRPIVIYCTIGVRSNKLAKKLSDEGYEVYDMKEGILGWANSELPVVDNNGLPTEHVHTYNKSFAHLLKRGTAIY